jgi:hypothetical protein
MKRGQATIFIIIGIVLVLIIALGFIFREGLTEQLQTIGIIQEQQLSEEAQEVYDHVEGCLETIGEEALILVGAQGGTIEPTGYKDIRYWYHSTNKILKTKEIEQEISNHINSNLEACTTLEEYNVEVGEFETETEILNEKTIITTSWDLEVYNEEGKEKISQIEYSFDHRIYDILEFINEILNSYLTDSLCLSCINDYALENEFEVTINLYEENIWILTLEDLENDYFFNIALKKELTNE